MTLKNPSTSNDEETLGNVRAGLFTYFYGEETGYGFQFQVHAQLMPSEKKLSITFYALEVSVKSIYQSNILGNLDMPLTLPYCCCRGNEII